MTREIEVPITPYRRTADLQSGIAVLVVAAVRLYREGLAAELRLQPGIRVAGQAADAEHAMALAAELEPHVVLLDISLSGSYALVREMTGAHPAVRVVAFAVDECEHDLERCAEAGVAGFVPRDVTVEDLVAAIAAAIRGEVRCSPRSATIIFRRLAELVPTGRAVRRESSLLAALTSREREIAAMLGRGRSNKDIGRELHIEVATVKNHVHRILEKLHVTTRGEAAACVRVLEEGRA